MTDDRLSAMEQCVRLMTTATSVAGLYGTEHQQFKHLCASAYGFLQEAMNDRPCVVLMRVDDRLAFDDQSLSLSYYAERFARHLKYRGIGFVKFLKDVTPEELFRFVTALGKRDKVIMSSDALRLGLVDVRYRHATAQQTTSDQPELGTPAGHPSLSEDEPLHQKETPDKSKIDLQEAVARGLIDRMGGEELARVMEIYEAVRRKRQLHVIGLSEIVTEFIAIFSRFADPILTMVPLRSMDEYTFTHSLNVCLLNLAQAAALGYEGQLVHDIGLSAMLHDIGKLFVPLEVLNKPGKLDDDEWALMREHPVTGARYLADSPGVPRMAVINAYEHHLRYDLAGYPSVNSDWQQNLCSQMTTISDIFDSMRTRRPYREPLSLDVVLDSIEAESGTQLHPLLVRNFVGIIRRSRSSTTDQALS